MSLLRNLRRFLKAATWATVEGGHLFREARRHAKAERQRHKKGASEASGCVDMLRDFAADFGQRGAPIDVLRNVLNEVSAARKAASGHVLDLGGSATESDLMTMLADHAGETGESEGARDVLRRILRENKRARAANGEQIPKDFGAGGREDRAQPPIWNKVEHTPEMAQALADAKREFDEFDNVIRDAGGMPPPVRHPMDQTPFGTPEPKPDVPAEQAPSREADPPSARP